MGIPAVIHLQDAYDAALALAERDSGFIDEIAEAYITRDVSRVWRLMDAECKRRIETSRDQDDEARHAA